MIKVAPACAIMIATFEHGKLFFHTYNADRALQHERDLQYLQHKRNNIK